MYAYSLLAGQEMPFNGVQHREIEFHAIVLNIPAILVQVD